MSLTDRITSLTQRIARELKTMRTSIDTKITGDGVTQIRSLTQAEYDALATKDNNVLYLIKV